VKKHRFWADDAAALRLTDDPARMEEAFDVLGVSEDAWLELADGFTKEERTSFIPDKNSLGSSGSVGFNINSSVRKGCLSTCGMFVWK
jgi:hypothetical protein